MIALCGEHHAKADAGAFSNEQLRKYKEDGIRRSEEIRGRFDWMRREMLAVIGGNFYLETPVMVEFRGEPAIWYNRDEDGYLLLNFRMLTVSGKPRVRLEDNFWLPRGEPDDVESPPNGRHLKVSYENGDLLQVEFFELEDQSKFLRRYPGAERFVGHIPFPITAVELTSNVGGTEVEFGPRETILPGNTVLKGGLIARCRVGLSFG